MYHSDSVVLFAVLYPCAFVVSSCNKYEDISNDKTRLCLDKCFNVPVFRMGWSLKHSVPCSGNPICFFPTKYQSNLLQTTVSQQICQNGNVDENLP